MARQGFQWFRQGYYKFMQDNADAIAAAMEAKAEDIVAAAGDGFEIDTTMRSGRRQTPRTAIIAATFEANDAEQRDRKLTRAVEANRD